MLIKLPPASFVRSGAVPVSKSCVQVAPARRTGIAPFELAGRPGRPLRAAPQPPGRNSVSSRTLPAPAPETESQTYSLPLGGSLPQLDAAMKLALACSTAFCLSNMDKTNFTIAVIPMGLEMGWSATTAGLVQSAFFYGFLAMQLPASILSARFGGSQVLPRGLALWSSATALIPLVAGNLPALCATRALMGMGEAVAPSAIVDMISRTVPPGQRASAISFAYGGLHVGSLVGLMASPLIIQAASWPALFYTFGAAGGVWLAGFSGMMRDFAVTDPDMSAKLVPIPAVTSTSGRSSGGGSSAGSAGGSRTTSGRRSSGGGAAAASPSSASANGGGVTSVASIPYRAFLRHPPVRTLMFTHFAHNWFHYTMLSWLPTYFTSALSVDLMHAAHTALLPPLAGIATSAAAGVLGDGLVARGVPTAAVRKALQGLAFLAPAAFLAYASQAPCTPENSNTVVACITGALGLCSFSLAGLYCSHQDLSPKYASVLLGLTNVAGSLPGIVGVATVGALYDSTNSWPLALFLPSGIFLVAGAAVYGWGSRHDPVDFDALDNSPFPFERDVSRVWHETGAAAAVASVSGAAQQPLAAASQAAGDVSQWAQAAATEARASVQNTVGALRRAAASLAGRAKQQQDAQEGGQGLRVGRPGKKAAASKAASQQNRTGSNRNTR